MEATYNVYCDESCHLEQGTQNVMVIGALWSPAASAPEHAYAIRQIIERHVLGQVDESLPGHAPTVRGANRLLL
jgi:hypothetical protein